MAAHLRSFGWPAGSCIAILSKNCAQWLIADFAIWIAGHVSVPIYPTLAATSIRQILDHSQAKAIFIGKLDGWDAMAPGVPDDIVRIRFSLAPQTGDPEWGAAIADVAPLQDDLLRGADELATIIYTSGTTGMPKGVMHSFANIAATAKTMGEVFKFGPDARVLRSEAHTSELQSLMRISYAVFCFK